MSTTLDPRRREAARLAELDRLGAMRPEADRVLQEIVDDAREVFGTDFCMANLVTPDTQYFKASSGELPAELDEVRRNPRQQSMCRYVVQDEEPLIVEDFSTAERFREQHSRMGQGVRFYAGTPLRTSGGHTVGTFCVLDSRPREFGRKDLATLRAFAGAVAGRLEALGAAARERAAKESERQYRRNVFELANDAILIYATETGLILDANRRAGETYGVPKEQMVGKKIGELSLEPEVEERHSRELLHRGSHRGFETVHRGADGGPIHVSINSSVTEYGGQRAILSIVRDVSERRRAEEALRASEESLAQAQRVAHIGNWEHELRDDRTRWSDEMYRIFGFVPGDLVPSYKTFMVFVHPEDRERVRVSIRAALYAGGPKEIDYRIVRPDGEVRLIHTQCEAVQDREGRPVKFFGTVQDVTEREAAEQKLRQAEEKYRFLVEQIPAVAYIDRADVPDVAVYTSPRIETLLGYTPEEWLEGRLWLERLHPDDRDWVLRADTHARSTEEPFGEEYRLIARDGRVVWVRDESALLRDEEGSPLLWQGVLLDVTRRKEAEEALRRSEGRFRSLIQNAPDVIMVLDAESTILYDSPSTQRVLGYGPGERIGTKGFDYVHPEDLGRVKRTFAEVLTNPGVEAPVEYRLRHKDGSWRHFEATRTNLLDDPAVGGVVINCRDITGRKRAEAALRESEERYRLVGRATNEVIWDNDLTTGEQEWNGAVLTMFGYSPQERRGEGRWWEERLHPEDRHRVLSSLEALLGGDGETWREEYRFRRRDGEYATVVDRGYVVRDAVGRPVRMLGSMMDITERKRAEGRLREAEEKYRTLVEQIPAVTYVQEAGGAGAATYVSPQMKTMLGYAPEECISDPRHWKKILHPDDKERVLAEDSRTGETGEPFSVEYRQFAKDGRVVWIRDEAALVRDEAGEPSYWLGVQTDVTERKRAEAALRESEERHRRQARELKLLHQVRTALAQELEPPAVFRTVVEAIARTYGYTLVSAYLLLEDDLVLQHQVGYERVFDRVPVGTGVMGRVARTGQPVLLGDVRRDPEFLGAMENIASEVCVPLLDQGEVVGTLNVESTGGIELTDDDLRLVSALAEYVNVALSRARLHARVRDSEQRFRSLIQNASDVITLLEVDGTMDYQSLSVARVLGYQPGELVGKNAFEYIHPEDVERVWSAFDEGVKNPEYRPFAEYRFRHKDGSWRHLESIGSNLLDDPGVGSFVVNSRDVTERKRWEARLRVAEERYRGLVETIPAITYVGELDRVSTSIYISPQVEAMLGFTAEERMATPALWVDQLHPEDRERVLAENDRSNATGEPFDTEYRMFDRDGREVWVHDASVVLRGAEGQPSYRQGVMFDVTERRRTEEALHASEMRLRTVIEQSPLGIHIFAPDGASLLANGAWDRLWCLDAEEPEHANVFEDEKLREAGLIEHIGRSVAGGAAIVAPPLLFDPANVRREGSARWLRALIYPVRGEDGRALETVLLLEDVTERKLAEDALKESEKRYRAVIERTTDGIFVADFETRRILESNKALQNMLGYAPEELAGMSIYEVIVGDREEIDRNTRRIFEEGNFFVGERHYRRKDGSLVEVESSATTIPYGNREVSCCIVRDVTRRKQAQEALRESERRYRAVVEQSAEAIWLFEPETKRVLEANAAFQEMLGYDAEELRNMTNYDFVAHSREDVDASVGRKLRGEENPRAERKYRKKDGTLLDVEVGGTVISYGGETVVCSVARDVTERKRVEEEMREANRHLSELTTLRADFTAMVAHEISAPLATIRGFVEVLETDELGGPEQAGVLAKIETEIDGLATLVADVRSAAAIEREDFSLAPRPVLVGDLIENAARFAETLPGDHRLLIEDAAAAGEKVRVDPYRIGQVLRNLLSNAAKHSPGGAPITLRASREEGSVRVEVADRGRGIHPDDAGRIFDKFGRGRERDGRRSYGVGLGLYLSRRIVRAHGGELAYSPEPAGGSVFSFDLETDG